MSKKTITSKQNKKKQKNKKTKKKQKEKKRIFLNKNNNNNNNKNKKHKRQKKKIKGWRRAMYRWSPYASTHGHFHHLTIKHFPPCFLPILGRKFLDGLERKHPHPTIIFPSSPPNQTLSKKFYFLIFFPSFLKSTLPMYNIKNKNKKKKKIHIESHCNKYSLVFDCWFQYK